MTCCGELEKLIDLELVRVGPVHKLPNGRILTEIDTEYFLAFAEDRPRYAGLNYCPFCGRVLSRGLWNLEKKK
jgi:nitrite reductase/ring-hydroxylating ferredoxin subunit